MGDTQTPMGVDLHSVELRLRTVQGDIVTMNNRFISGPSDSPNTSVCFVVVLGPGQEQRLCMSRDAANNQSVTFAENGGMPRIMGNNEVGVGGPIGGAATLNVRQSVGLRIEAALSFYVEALNGGQRTDVLPDTGTIPLTEVFGR